MPAQVMQHNIPLLVNSAQRVRQASSIQARPYRFRSRLLSYRVRLRDRVEDTTPRKTDGDIFRQLREHTRISGKYETLNDGTTDLRKGRGITGVRLHLPMIARCLCTAGQPYDFLVSSQRTRDCAMGVARTGDTFVGPGGRVELL